MIKLKQLNGAEIVINADLIKFIQTGSDTLITMLDGDVIAVDGSIEHIMKSVVEYKQNILGIHARENLF